MSSLSLFGGTWGETVLSDAKVLGGVGNDRISLIQKGRHYIVRQSGCPDYETKDRSIALKRYESRAKPGTVENY